MELTPGYKAYNGYVFTQADCDSYNAIQKRIKSFGDTVPEHLLNARHKLFSLITSKKYL